VIEYLPVLVRAVAPVRLLPNCTLPKFTGVPLREASPNAKIGIRKKEAEKRIQQAGLRGDPRHFMSYALF
jgi:hypothetical protein